MHLPKQAKAKKTFSRLCILSVTLIALLPTFSAFAALRNPRKLPSLNAQPDPTTIPTPTTTPTIPTTPTTPTTTPTTTQPPNTTTDPNNPSDPNHPTDPGTGTPSAGNDPSNRLNQPGAANPGSANGTAAEDIAAATNSPALLNLNSCRMVSIAPGSRVAKAGNLEAYLTVLGGSPTTANRRFSARLVGKTKGALKRFTTSLNNKSVSTHKGEVLISPKMLGNQTHGKLKFTIYFANGMKKSLTLNLRYWPCKRVLWINRRGNHLRVRIATDTPVKSVSFFLPKEISLTKPKNERIGSILFDKQRFALKSGTNFLTNGVLRIAQPLAQATYSKSARSITVSQFKNQHRTIEIELKGTALISKHGKWFNQNLQTYAQLADQEGDAKVTAKVKKRK